MDNQAFLQTLAAAGIALTGFTGNALAADTVQGIHNAPIIAQRIALFDPAVIKSGIAQADHAIAKGIERFDRSLEGFIAKTDRAGEAFDKIVMPTSGPFRGVDHTQIDHAFENQIHETNRLMEQHLEQMDRGAEEAPVVKPPVL